MPNVPPTAVIPAPAPLNGTGPVAAAPTDLAKEYVSGLAYGWYTNLVAALPPYIDELQRDFPRVYEQMLLHPVVASAVNIRRMADLAQGWSVLPAPAPAPAYQDLAARIAGFCQANLTGLARPFRGVLWELLGGLATGHAVAEQVYDYVTGYDPQVSTPQIALVDLVPKPLENLLFVIDVYGRELGIKAVQPGQAIPFLAPMTVGTDGTIPGLLDRAKFCVYYHQRTAKKLLGQSALRPAYDDWWESVQLQPEYLKYLVQFASPIPIGELPPNAAPQPARDPITGQPLPGAPLIYPQDALLRAIEHMHNGSAVVVANGGGVRPFHVPGDGQAFTQGFSHHAHNIVICVLFQSLATGEAKHDSSTQARVHQDILGLVVNSDKEDLATTIQQDVFRPLVAYNYGPWAARHLCPRLNLGKVENEDLAAMLTALSRYLAAGGIHRSQLPGLDDTFHLPPRDMAAWEADYAREQAALADAAAAARTQEAAAAGKRIKNDDSGGQA